ncbi:hypothetical protein ACSBR2_013671 [Camellia fascicularis]
MKTQVFSLKWEFDFTIIVLLGKCTDRDISITQGQGSSTGIPEYIVEIINTCLSDDCPPSNIHLHCGLFASARLVDPQLFKRLSNDDCLVNGGKPLKVGSHGMSPRGVICVDGGSSPPLFDLALDETL